MLKPNILAEPRVRGALRPAGLLILVLALAAGPAPVRAEGDKPAPGNKLEIGFEERIRSENWDNALDFNNATRPSGDVRHQLRFRTRVWSKVNLGSRAEFMVGLNDESRKIYTPEAAARLDETVFETLYIDYKLTDRLGARFGRQNLVRGDGFLVMDGGPAEGSRTAYFNALDVTLDFGKSKLDLLAIADPSRDQYLPVIHDQHKQLIEWNEQALGLCYQENRIAATVLDATWFYKEETEDYRRPKATAQPDRRLHTLDARVTRQLPHGLSLMAEVAGQMGRQEPDVDIQAWGIQTSLKKTFPLRSRPSVALGWVGLSGDDPETADTAEGWDPLFSRYPKWSDGYIYTLPGEKGVAYWSNLMLWQAEFLITPAKPLNLRATCYHLGAFHRFPGKAEIFARGTQRGDMFQARADLKVNDNWRGHLVGEYLTPGSFYASDDAAWFLRAEVTASFRKVFGL